MRLPTEKEIAEIKSQAAKDALCDPINTYDEDILDILDLDISETLCGHEYMIRKLELDNIALQKKLDKYVDDTMQILSSYVNGINELKDRIVKLESKV